MYSTDPSAKVSGVGGGIPSTCVIGVRFGRVSESLCDSTKDLADKSLSGCGSGLDDVMSGFPILGLEGFGNGFLLYCDQLLFRPSAIRGMFVGG